MKVSLVASALAVAVLPDKSFCFSVAVKSVPILTSSDPSDPINFDSGCVANPVVLPPDEYCSEWQCYYYGNAGSWNGGRTCYLPTGSSGLAESSDGLTWTKIKGTEEGGSILTPSDSGWDSVHTGVGDVLRVNGDLHMYYFGASEEEIAMGPGVIAGFRMRIGRAKSNDNGRTWVKDDGFLLDYDESEGFFASWPRIVASKEHPWKMFYHVFDGQKWRVFGAVSRDEGDSWTRTGLVLEGSDDKDAFDYEGIGTRDVIPWHNGLLMISEGVDKQGTHRLGAAFCDGKTGEWVKLNDGKPILEPGKGPMGDWTVQVIGTPYIVSLPDGSLRVYHCGKDGPDGKMAIGVVVSESGDVGPESWKAMNN